MTCAKLIATLYTQLGLKVQTFGDYGSERSGAPVQAYTRVDRQAITNRNKVYEPDHLIVLDEALMGPAVLSGTSPGALLLLNSRASLDTYAGQYSDYRFGVVDATAIAREHGIGSSAVEIINTTILGAYVRLLGMPLDALERAFTSVGLQGDLAAAAKAYETVQIRPVLVPEKHSTRAHENAAIRPLPMVLPTTEHHPTVRYNSKPARGAHRRRVTANTRHRATRLARQATTYAASSTPSRTMDRTRRQRSCCARNRCPRSAAGFVRHHA